MNHERHYHALILKSRERGKPDGYAERHHVLPRSLGGGDEPENLVWLTPREHFIAHLLLARIHGGSQWYAAMMFAAGRNRTVSSRLYDMAKRQHAAWMSAAYRGVPLSPERRAAIGVGLCGNKNTAGRALSESHRAAISRSLVGNKRTLGKRPSAETKAKMSAAHSGPRHQYFGKERDPETRAKISAKLKGVKRAPRSEETKARIRAGVLAANAAKRQTNA